MDKKYGWFTLIFRRAGLVLIFALTTFLVLGLNNVFPKTIEDRLKEGEIIVEKIEKGDIQGVKVLALIDADIDKVWKVVTDYDNFKDYMPNTIESKVLARDKNIVYYKGTLNILGLKITYHLKHTLQVKKGERVDKWEKAKGKYAFKGESIIKLEKTYGSWTLKSYGNKTLSIYYTYLKMKHNLPEVLMEKAISLLLSVSAPGIIKATRQRVKEMK